jgi:hypothetical protein
VIGYRGIVLRRMRKTPLDGAIVGAFVPRKRGVREGLSKKHPINIFFFRGGALDQVGHRVETAVVHRYT